MSETKTERRKAFFVYVGETSEGRHTYYTLNSMADNTGKPAEEMRLERFTIKTKIGYIGGIINVEFEGNNVHFSKKTLPLDNWSCKSDLIKWRTANTAVQVLKSRVSEGKTNMMHVALKPIKQAYKEASIEERRGIIAEILRYITT